MSKEDTTPQTRKEDAFPAFSISFPARKDLRGGARQVEVSNFENEALITTRFGIDGIKASIRIYGMNEDVLYNMSYGDDVLITVGRGPGSIKIPLIVERALYEPPEDDDEMYSFTIECVGRSAWNLGRKPIFTINMEKLATVKEILQAMLDKVFESTPEMKPALNFISGTTKYKYSWLYNDGTKTLQEIIDQIAIENDLEWYMNPYGDSFFIGQALPVVPIFGPSMTDSTSTYIKKFRIGYKTSSVKIDGITFSLVGTPVALTSGGLYYKKQLFKIIKAAYFIKGDGYSETWGQSVWQKNTATNAVMRATGTMYKDTKYYNPFHVGDMVVAEDEKPWKMMGKAIYKKKMNNENEWNPSKYEFIEGLTIHDIKRSSLFAGNGVGFLLPVSDKARHLIFMPEGKSNYSILGPQIWKEGDVIPECNQKDLYLRMEKGLLYFDEAAKTWLVKAENVKLEADNPDAADTKPNVGNTECTYIKIGKDGNVTVKGKTITVEADNINLGGGAAAKHLAYADHTHDITMGPPGSPVPATVMAGGLPLSMGTSKSNSRKTKSE